MRKKKLKITAFLLTLCMVAITIGASHVQAGSVADEDPAAQKQEIESTKNELQENLQKAKDALSTLESEKASAQAEVSSLEASLKEVQADLEELSIKLDEQEAAIEETQEKLLEAEVSEQEQYEAMKKRIQYMYENGGTNHAYLLLSSESISEFLNRAEYVQNISQYDRTMLEKYQTLKKDIEDINLQLNQELENLESIKEEIAAKQVKLEGLITEKSAEVNSYDGEIEMSEELMAEYQAELEVQNEILDFIAQYEAQLQREQQEEADRLAREEQEARDREAAEKAAAAEEGSEGENGGTGEEGGESGGSSEGGSSSGSESNSGGGSSSGSGGSNSGGSTPPPATGLIWPCPGNTSISSYFGPRTSPTAGASSDHKGIDIRAPKGANIVAAASGTVIISTYSASAGNYITISHGNGLYTVYMHCSALYVGVGQTVSQGQSIAAVGSTGISTGNHLHFGVSKNGTYVNPLGYVSP